ncbi:hypothetical protein ACVK1X_000237 [Pseudomonas sp. PvR086]|nr:hypothetical protein [Pseudomonas frederiksbergensis]
MYRGDWFGAAAQPSGSKLPRHRFCANPANYFQARQLLRGVALGYLVSALRIW